jgi:hypothetical protein
MMHGFSHIYSIGWADDGNQNLQATIPKPFRRGEVYTGSRNDTTVEDLNNKRRWPVMSLENNVKYETKPMEGRYFAFGVEEAGSAQE